MRSERVTARTLRVRPEGPRPCGSRRPKPAHGFSLVALLVFIAIMSILLAAAGPLWSNVVKRDREEELIFRGKQYVFAIQQFQKRYGRAPMALRELVELKPRTIRRLYKDPMTNSADWGLIYQGGITSENLGQTGPGVAPPGPGSNPRPGGGPVPPTTAEPRPGGEFGAGPSGGATGPIVGVYSKSDKRSLRTYLGRQKYSEWKFTILPPGGIPLGGTVGNPPLGGK